MPVGVVLGRVWKELSGFGTGEADDFELLSDWWEGEGATAKMDSPGIEPGAL